MSSFTNVFTGSPVQVAPTTYRYFIFGSNTTLSWPQYNNDDSNVTADVMEVIASSAGLDLCLPPANQASNGQSTLVRNLGANSFTVCDNDGNTIQIVAAGQAFWIYVTDNQSVAGAWSSFQFGTGTSAADATALAGNGLIAISTTLNTAVPVNQFNSTFTLTQNYRGSLALWTGGVGTFNFDPAATLGNSWFIMIKNSGSGNLTLDPSTTEQIDGASSISLAPGESCIVACSGTALYSISKNSQVTISFTRLVKSVAGSSNVTLTSAEAGYDIQEYTGTLTGNISVIVPTAVSRWWVYNNTNGAFSLTVRTAAGTGIAVAQGTRTILHCDGTNVVRSVDVAAGSVSSVGTGTGLIGGPITSTGTISLANTAVSPGTYGSANTIPSITVDAQGRLTAASGISLDPDLVAIGNLATTGLIARTGAGTAATRTITGGAGITITNGDGVAGNPTISSAVTFVPVYSAIAGFLPTSISGTSTTAAVTISAGQATDSLNASLFASSGFSWSVANGNAANGYQSGSTLPNSTTVHFFAIATNADTTWSASFASTSVTPTLPGSYTKYRRIFSLRTSASGALLAGSSVEVTGGAWQFFLNPAVLDVSTTSLGTTGTLFSLTVPTGIKLAPLFRCGNGTNPSNILITSGDEPDNAPGTADTAPIFDGANGGAGFYASPGFRQYITNTSGQIRARSSTASTTFYLSTLGWLDFRR